MSIVVSPSSPILTLSLIIAQVPFCSMVVITVKTLAIVLTQGHVSTNLHLCRLVLSNPKCRHAGYHVPQLVNLIRWSSEMATSTRLTEKEAAVRGFGVVDESSQLIELLIES